MLTQQEVRQQLDNIADEVTLPPGLHYELFSRLYSQRVRRWIRSVPHSEAVVIQREIENDPDYLADAGLDAEKISPPPKRTSDSQTMLINPAWDMDY